MLQKFVENLHLILPGIALVLWALAKLFASLGQSIEGDDFFERNADRIKAFSDTYAYLLDQACKMGLCKLKGLEKTEEITKRVKEAEALWEKGKKIEAVTHLSGVAQALLDKVKVNLPFPVTGSGAGGTTNPPAAGATPGPDDVI